MDEPTLEALDRLVKQHPVRRKRSELVREAVAEFLARRAQLDEEDRERAALAKHRKRLAREVRAMVAAQARP